MFITKVRELQPIIICKRIPTNNLYRHKKFIMICSSSNKLTNFDRKVFKHFYDSVADF